MEGQFIAHIPKGNDTADTKKPLPKKKRKINLTEYIAERIFLVCALVVVLCVGLITFYIFLKGAPAIFEIGIAKFLGGDKWIPGSNIFGILPMIVGSIFTTAGAVIIGLPTGILTAVFICEYAPKPVSAVLNPAIDLLAGIPSVVYGFFGLVVIVPLINTYFGGKGAGNSVLAASLILGIMILPTVITTSKTALKSVPGTYREGAYALGASKEQAIFSVMLPAAKSGVFSGAVLAIGRAIGETMAVILVAGNSTIIPTSITDPVRTMTANIAIEMGYSTGLHQEALFATGVVLFIFIMLLNIVLHKIQKGV